MSFRHLLACGAVLAVLFGPIPNAADAAERVRIGGTGVALASMSAAGEKLAARTPPLAVEVLPSLGTPGGVRALIDGKIDIALLARPLLAEEAAKGAREMRCLVTPLVFATTHATATGLSRATLAAAYAEIAPKWDDGTPLKIVLRSKSSSEVPFLFKAFPELEAPIQAAHKRPGMPIGATDQDNAEIAEKTEGALAIITLMQIRSERRRLRALAIEGVVPDADTVENRLYPLGFRVCLAQLAEGSPAAAQFIAYLDSAPGRSLMRSLGAVSYDR